jgi:peptide/nickel transport system substrate-binding protein
MMHRLLQRAPKPIALVAVLITASLIAACGSSSPSTQGSASASNGSGSSALSQLVVDDSTPPATLDPAEACSLQDIGLISDLYVTLVKHAVVPSVDGTQQLSTNSLVGELAKSWATTQGGTVYTFHLIPGAKFPDGQPTDSAAVKYSIERAMKLGACGANFAAASNPTPLIKSIGTPNATTVVFTLAHPEANFLQALTSPNLGIVDPALIKAHGGVVANTPNQWLASHSAGSGPYVLSSYQSGTQAVYTANPTFLGAKPLVPKVQINFITSDPTLLLQARSGQADVTLGLSNQSVASLKSDSAVRIISTPAAQWELVSLPNKLAPFNNPTVREALSYAVPYQQILQSVTYGYGRLYYGPFPPAFAAYNAKYGAPRTTDLAKAKSLLASAHVTAPLDLKLYVREGDNDGEHIATLVQAAWKPLGVDVTIDQLTSAAYQNAVGAPTKKYALVRSDGPSIPNPEWLLDYDMKCRSPYNTSNFCSPEADALLAKASTLSSPAAQQPYWNKIAAIWIAASPRIPVYQQNVNAVLKSGITHYVFGQNDTLFHLWGP